MFGKDAIQIVLTRACYVAGTPYPEGARVKLPAVEAVELVEVIGAARYADPRDADRARQAHVEAINRDLARSSRNPAPLPSSPSPWAPWR